MAEPLVLIVDNEEGLLVLFGQLVKRLGCDIIQVDNGNDAIDILKEQAPDLLILDLAMPFVSGFDVLRAIADESHLGDMRVMVLTATGPGPAPQDISHLIDRWVTKPVLPTAFIDQVSALLDLPGE